MNGKHGIAIKDFEGAPDDDPYPQRFLKGDPIAGDLADVAIGEKWAREAKDQAEFDSAVEAQAKRLAPSEPAGDDPWAAR